MWRHHYIFSGCVLFTFGKNSFLAFKRCYMCKWVIWVFLLILTHLSRKFIGLQWAVLINYCSSSVILHKSSWTGGSIQARVEFVWYIYLLLFTRGYSCKMVFKRSYINNFLIVFSPIQNLKHCKELHLGQQNV